ncbi:D-2-hydroxyacid dehydrogenase [Variovorax sp. VNK109]|uniref:D-2-hydroxyacid dehydrogenase n=1 Tax=Variovorax sp. VNK109 TaxID=3400919 RepID=UPI003C0281ED
MKVVFGGQIARAPVLAALRATEGIELTAVDEVQDVISHVAGAEVLVIANPRGSQGGKVAAALNAEGSTVRWVQVVSAGLDGLTGYPLPKHVIFTNQGGAAAPAVAEHAVALLLALCRKLDVAYAGQVLGDWRADIMKTQTRSIEGSVVGIVGMGNIGREVAKRVRAFGATVHGFSRKGEPDSAADGMFRIEDLSKHVGELDVIVLALALTPETHHLFDSALLSRCKSSCLLVNVARGEVVNSSALETALREGHIAGAAIDVTEPEPLPAQASLWSAPNLIITPHIAATGNKRVGIRIASVVRENLDRYRKGEPLLNVVRI